MELILERIAKRKAYTIGRLSIQRRVDDEYLAGTEDQYFCDTLEPTWRDYEHGAYKIKGKSAIPEGRYTVVISWSPKFKAWFYWLLVPYSREAGHDRAISLGCGSFLPHSRVVVYSPEQCSHPRSAAQMLHQDGRSSYPFSVRLQAIAATAQ